MKSEVSYQHALLIRGAQLAGITIMDLARAIASMEGRAKQFDEGHYEHATIKAEALVEMATQYARQRKGEAKAP